jgi:hypothetical protein
MTRPTKFAYSYPQGVGIPGGDPTLPEGQPPVDCCADAEEMPDRALDQAATIGVPVSALFAEIVADGPDWYYQLDEPSGAFLDSSGNGVTATETGTITRSVAGPIAGEDGITADTGEYLTLGYTATSLSAATIEGWYRWSGSSAVFIEQNRYGSGVGLCLQIAIGTTTFGAGDGQITAFFNTTSYWLGIHTTGTYNDDAWHHVVATWAGGGTITTGQLTIYVDGVSVATTSDSGNGGGPNSAPISGQGSMSLFNRLPPGAGGAHGTVSADEMAFYPTALSAARVLAHYDASGGATDWRGAGPEMVDGDDTTCQEVIGSDVLRVWLGDAFAIGRVRLVIECENSGAKTYVLKGANQSDFSDATTEATLNFTATGSFTADIVTDSWSPTGSYEYWELTGDDETRNICSFELYEAGSESAAAVQAALDDHLVDTVDAHDASAVSIVDAGGYFTATQVEGALQELGAGSVAGWFNVMAYGATNDGTTDDTAAINLAIAALNTATRGVLYFPAGAGYKVTAALTAITAAVVIRGDGVASYDYATHVTTINCTSQTAVLFTLNNKYSRVEHIALRNTYAGTPSAGSAILVDSAYLEQKCDFDDIRVHGFYNGVDVKVGAQWYMHGSLISDVVNYGVRIRNTVNPDAGDWAITDSWIYAGSYDAVSAIRVESSGGGKIANVKINSGYPTVTNQYVTGIDVAIATGNNTIGMWISNCSIENISGDAVRVVTTGTGFFDYVIVDGLQVALSSNNTGFAVKISAAANGGHAVAGAISMVSIDGGTFWTDGTARAAVSLTNADRVTLGDYVIDGFNARYTGSGNTNVVDGATVTLAGDVSGPSGTTSVDKVKGVTITDAGTTGTVLTKTGATTATWSTPSGGGTTGGPILIADDHSTPIVFGDFLLTEEQDDLLYADSW